MYEILNCFILIVFNLVFLDQWITHNLSFFSQNLVFIKYDLWSLFVTLSWWHDAVCQTHYPELTWWPGILVPTSITVPVCYIGIESNWSFSAVEHKKIGIRHIVLCVKMQTDLFYIFSVFVWPSWKSEN